MKRESFVFYKDWVNAIRDLPAEVRLDVYDAVAEYAISGKLSDLKPMAKIAFSFIRQTIDRDTEKYVSISEKRSDSGKKGAVKKWQTMANDGKNSKCYDNDNVNDNVNENVNEKEKKAREKKTTEFNFVFLEAEYENSFRSWLTYKTERGEPPKTQQQAEAMYRELKTLSKCSAQEAEIIVNQSISNNWKGLFPVEKKEKNPRAATAYRQNVSTEDFLADRANF